MVTIDLLDSEKKARLKDEINATDEELISLENLLKIQKEKVNLRRESRGLPSVVIEDFLYHGDLGHAIDINLLLDLQILHILNICDCPLDKEINEIFDVLWIDDLEDNFQGQIQNHFDQTNQFLIKCKNLNEKVLVHCQAGISRSSSIVLAYLIKHNNQTLEKAYEYLLDRRPIAAPNYAFLLQLIRYEKEIANNNRADDQQNPITPQDNFSTGTTF